jgi:hypothetical protein
MPHSLTVELKGSYLHCVVRGENGRETVLAYFAEIREQCRIRDRYRVLVEERLTGPRFSLEELFQVAAEAQAQAGATFEILAYVDINAESDTVAQVAKMIVTPGSTVGIFNTVAEAEAWLRSKER